MIRRKIFICESSETDLTGQQMRGKLNCLRNIFAMQGDKSYCAPSIVTLAYDKRWIVAASKGEKT